MHAASPVDCAVPLLVPYSRRATWCPFPSLGAALGAVVLWSDSVRLRLIFGYRLAVDDLDEMQHVGEQASHR